MQTNNKKEEETILTKDNYYIIYKNKKLTSNSLNSDLRDFYNEITGRTIPKYKNKNQIINDIKMAINNDLNNDKLLKYLNKSKIAKEFDDKEHTQEYVDNYAESDSKFESKSDKLKEQLKKAIIDIESLPSIEQLNCIANCLEQLVIKQQQQQQ